MAKEYDSSVWWGSANVMVGHDVFIFVFTHLDQFMEVIMRWVGIELLLVSVSSDQSGVSSPL